MCLFKRKILLIFLLIFIPLSMVPALPCLAVTYYVRPDGGAGDQCTGLADAPYPGSGTDQACAWSHPFWALDGAGDWKIQGGDTLLISQGTYRIGINRPETTPTETPNTAWCDTGWPWECTFPPLPSGLDPEHPTRILGKGWDQGCPDPPEFWGSERVWQVISLEGTSNAKIACLELTDRSGCVEHHDNPQVRCERDTYPYGDWASDGIYAADASNITLRNLNVHGFASAGIRAGRISEWTVEEVRIAGNGWVGWEGDLVDEDDANSGDLVFRKWVVEWNGCAETYPGENPEDCWAQTAGGYGDGVGTGKTGGHWIIEDSLFRYNTSDGLDLLYARLPDSRIEIRRTMAYGNAGNQIKVNGPTIIENSLMVGNCGFFEGKPFTYNVDNCRGSGAALALNFRQGVSVMNCTVAGEGDCLATVECDEYSACDGSETVTMKNNIFLGYKEFLEASDRACYLWFDNDNFYKTDIDYNLVFGAKIGVFGLSAHDVNQDPLLRDEGLSTFDGRLRPGSPAIDSGLGPGGLVPDHDLKRVRRPVGRGVDRGAYEYQGVPLIPLTLLLTGQ